MSKEFQIRDGNLIASFDLENEDGDIDFCKLLKVSHGVADEIGMFVDYVATNKIIKDQSKKIADLEAKLAEIKNQTAIVELEKVKNFLLEKIEEKQSCFDSGNYNDFADGVKTICELMLISIDKQIKELGGVENVF